MLPDLSRLLPEQRTQLALQIQRLSDFDLPDLDYLNTSPCSVHSSVVPWCRNCGLIPRAHQRVGAAWLYARGKGLLCDETGLGKTLTCAIVIAMLKQIGQLDHGRVVVACRAAAVKQWERELNRILPKIRVAAALGTAKQRLEIFYSDWEVMITGKELFRRDWEAYNQLDLVCFIIDDCDELRNHQTKFAHAAKLLAPHTRWTIVANATPLAKHLQQMHSTLEVIGGREIFGSKTRFLNTYTTQAVVRIPVHDKSGNITRFFTQRKITSYVNIGQFKQLLTPMAMRRTAAQLPDVDMPDVITNNVWLDMYPPQRAKYREIQDGILRIIKAGKLSEVTRLQALQIWGKGAMVCTGLPALGEDDGPEASSKLDWLMDKLEGDLEAEKVLVFVHNIAMLRAIQARFEDAEIGYVTVSGLDSNARRRDEAVQQFWNDPECRVMLGTRAMTSSLNLQVSRHIVFMDTIPNPASMMQVLGRIKRQGSKFQTVFAHVLLTRDSQEEAMLAKLEVEAALMDTVWDDSNDLFEPLDTETLLRLIVS